MDQVLFVVILKPSAASRSCPAKQTSGNCVFEFLTWQHHLLTHHVVGATVTRHAAELDNIAGQTPE